LDVVDILSGNRVKKWADGGFIADAAWTVSGSVSHFGHTHYRRNQYQALVTFIIGGGKLKISNCSQKNDCFDFGY
jgi:hypothetical protein